MRIKRRQKPLLPSLRERKRYIAFEIISNDKIDDFTAVSGQIKASAQGFLGELEMAKAGIMLMGDKWEPSEQRGIIRVSPKYVKQVQSSLALIESIRGKKAIARSIGVSGMLKKAYAI